MASKPTVAIVPGAWHSPGSFDALITFLNAAGYPTVSKRLPSVDTATPTTTTAEGDAKFIVDQVLNPLLNDGKDIVFVAHSYGGSPGGAAVNGLSKADRAAAGLQGGIIGLVWIAALVAPNNVSLLQLVGGKFNDWVEIDTPSAGYTFPSTPKEVFYNDVPTPIANVAISELRKMSTLALSTGAGAPGWANPGFQGRLAYVRTGLDQCIPDFAQDGMMAGSGVKWDVKPFNTSHSPFLSQPKQLSETIDALAKGWSS